MPKEQTLSDIELPHPYNNPADRMQETYPQSDKDTERMRDADSARLYNSTTPLLVPTARICWSEATEVHTASSEPNFFSGLIYSTCFKPLLLTEHDTSCPSEYKTNSNLIGKQSSSCTIAVFLVILWLDTEPEEALPEAKPLPKECGEMEVSLLSRE